MRRHDARHSRIDGRHADEERGSCAGMGAVMHEVARELHPQLVHEARLHLGDLDHEADDVVQDLFVAALEGRLRPPRGRGEGVAHLLRLTAVFARKHARNVRRFRDLE